MVREQQHIAQPDDAFRLFEEERPEMYRRFQYTRSDDNLVPGRHLLDYLVRTFRAGGQVLLESTTDVVEICRLAVDVIKQ